MALWDKITSRGNVEDRRGSSGFGIGKIGLGGIIIVGLFTYFSGGNINDFFGNLQSVSGPAQTTEQSSGYEGQDEYEVFASQVLGSVNDAFSAQVDNYTQPQLVLFRGSTSSVCGGAYSSSGPHYCPTDQTIYLDETFFEELANTLGAHGGDVAQAYVIAHEAGHHVQNITNNLKKQKTNSESIETELQADCLAGVWAYSLKDKQIFEPDEINEAIDAAKAVGDDAIQQKIEGSINEHEWTHGSSKQRMDAFLKGYTEGQIKTCNILFL